MGPTTFVNARVFTGTSETATASAFTVAEGRFTWVGEGDDLRAADREGAVDLDGATVLPGFLDVHTHPVFTATLAGAAMVLPPAVGSIEELVATLTEHAAATPGDSWVLGFGYDESSYPEGRKPDRHDLDRVSSTRPVLVRRCDGHSAVCNTRALELAGITEATPDPVGGRFGRGPDGTPDGVLTEPPAVDPVDGRRPVQSQDDLARAIVDLEPHYLSQGLVGICDLLSTFVAEPLQTFRLAQDKGFRLQCGLYYGWREAIAALPDGPAEGDTEGRVHLAGLKLFADGAFSDRTAWCKHPYPGGHDTGMGLLSPDDIRRAADWARAYGIQLAFHAMGDQAIQQVVDALGDEEPWVQGAPSVRIDHATLVSEEMLAQIEGARMSFAIVSHTIFYFAEYGSYDKALTDDLRGEAYPIRRYYGSSLPTALASDAPATAWSEVDHVFTSIKAAVVRRAHTGADIGQGQAVTLPQAILLYTARAARLEGLGQIAEGFEGSFVVLDRDPFAIPEDELDQVQVAQTWLRGEQVYTR